MKSSLAFGIAVGGAALVAVLVLSRVDKVREAIWGPANPPIAAAVPPGSQTAAALRTVVVIEPGKAAASPLVAPRECGLSPDCRNGAGGVDVVTLLSGDPPVTPVTAVVLTDTDCMPDSFGISHCLNKLRLAGGAILKVRHDHNMDHYPCLAPGERVRVIPASA